MKHFCYNCSHQWDNLHYSGAGWICDKIDEKFHHAISPYFETACPQWSGTIFNWRQEMNMSENKPSITHFTPIEMSRRDYFAGMALAAMIANPDDNSPSKFAGWAVEYADALIAALDNKGESE